MKRLKIILKSKIFLIVIILLTIIRLLITITSNNKSIFDMNTNEFTCIVTNVSNSKITLDCHELLEATIESNDIEIGDILHINGTLKEYDKQTNINLFDYKEYQNKRGIFYKLKIDSYKKIGNSKNLILNIKKLINNRIKNLKSYAYLKTFILGDKSDIDKEIINSIKDMGIIHLFSISGMHISLFFLVLEKIFDRSNKKSIIIASILFIYYELIKSISLLRCLVFIITRLINKKLNLNIKKEKELLISIILILIIKPIAIYDLGLYYSVIISTSISLVSYKFNIKNKYYKRIIITLTAFLFFVPLNIYSNYEINLLSIIYNLIFIPLITFIIFPLSLLTFIFPILDSLFMLIINIFLFLINIFKNINVILIFMKPSIIVLILYYLILYLSIYNYKLLVILFFILIIHYNYNSIIKSKYLLMLDVGQGDSIFLHLDNKDILIDTGGNLNFSIVNNITIDVLKSLGIRKLDYLILTHGDNDHMGEAINLINNFKVEKVIFNCGVFNDLEQELIQVLDKKKIPYYSCIKRIDNLYFLQTREYDNENDNSNVIYTEINNIKFLFMGDAEIDKEKDILNNYNISNIDVLKVGHHGSKTSSGENFINEMNPKYSIISVGKNNRYGHPNKEVLKNLDNSKIYRTDLDGSVLFKIVNNKLVIEKQIS